MYKDDSVKLYILAWPKGLIKFIECDTVEERKRGGIGRVALTYIHYHVAGASAQHTGAAWLSVMT